MTFIVGPGGVENTDGTEASFGGGGFVRVGGNFKNSGKVNVDTKANLDVLGDIINSGSFNILDYATKEKYAFFENAIKDLNGDAKIYTQEFYLAVQKNEPIEAKSKLAKLVSYFKDHPELVTSSVQVLLQLFYR